MATSNYQIRLIGTFLVVNLLTVSVGGLSLIDSRRQGAERAALTVNALAGALEQTLSGMVERVDLMLLNTVAQVEEQGGNKRAQEKLNAIIAREYSHQPELVSLFLFDADGVPRSAAGANAASRFSIADRDYFLQARSDAMPRLIVSKPLISRAGQQPVLVFVRRVTNADGSFGGLVAAVIEISHLQEIFRGLGLGTSDVATLIDLDRKIIARLPEPDGVGSAVGKQIVSPELVNALGHNNESGTYNVQNNFDHVHRVMSYRKLRMFPGYVFVGQATQGYVSEWRAQVIVVGALLAIIFSVSGFFAWSLNANWKRQVHNKRLMEQLNAELEVRVQERTDELEHANANLLQTISQLEQTQHSLVQSEKLSALGSMVAGVAHELNTPLGNARIVLSTHEEQLVQVKADLAAGKLSRSKFEAFFDQSVQMVQLALRAIDTSVNLVGSFKQVARDQASEARRVFDLAQTIEDLLASLRPRFKRQPWEILVDVPPGIELDSFPGALGQVLLNLVMNSVIHGFDNREHGRITITAKNAAKRDAVILGVADDGVGIAPDHVGRVFDPFFTTKLGKGGSGIGLNISYRIVTKVLGGTIRVDSTPGQGTLFEMVLPLRAPDSV